MDYEENTANKALIWQHFLRAKDKNSSKCKICNKVLKTSGGSTSTLHKHLKNVHDKKVTLLSSTTP